MYLTIKNFELRIIFHLLTYLYYDDSDFIINRLKNSLEKKQVTSQI